jgi:hypothetical protein
MGAKDSLGNKFGVEIQFREELEKYFVSRGVPAMLIIAGGGPNSYKTVLAYVRLTSAETRF